MKYLTLAVIFIVGLIVMALADTGPFAGIIWATGLFMAIGVPALILADRDIGHQYRRPVVGVDRIIRSTKWVPTHPRPMATRTTRRRVA